MYKFPIGVMLDSFRLNAKDAIEKAAELGVQGLQMYATTGEFAPENMNRNKKQELLNMLKANGLEFSALCGDLGMGFGNRDLNPGLIEKSKRILDLAKELETNIVTTHIGVVPMDKKHDRYKIMQEACFELARYADNVNAHFAIETGPEIATTLKMFLDDLGSKGVSVNFDPANFVMVTGDDPVQAVYTLKDYIVHTHAKDGKKLRECAPEVVYRIIDEETNQGDAYIELPLGDGDVHFKDYLNALNDIGYKGFLTIEREVGKNPVSDISLAVEFLRNAMK